MKTFIYTHKNMGVSVTISAASEEEAWEVLKGIVTTTEGWRYVGREDEGDEEQDSRNTICTICNQPKTNYHERNY